MFQLTIDWSSSFFASFNLCFLVFVILHFNSFDEKHEQIFRTIKSLPFSHKFKFWSVRPVPFILWWWRLLLKKLLRNDRSPFGNTLWYPASRLQLISRVSKGENLATPRFFLAIINNNKQLWWKKNKFIFQYLYIYIFSFTNKVSLFDHFRIKEEHYSQLVNIRHDNV